MPRRALASTFLLLMIIPAAALAADGPVVYRGQIDQNDHGWIRQPDGTYRLDFAGDGTLGITGQADLPVRDLVLLVPADLPVTGVVIEPVRTRREPLPGPLAVAAPLLAGNGDQVPRHDLEPRDGLFPPTWGEFGGLHTWRGYRLLSVTVHPFRVADDGNTLEVLEQFTVRAVLDPSLPLTEPLDRQRRVLGERRALDATLRALVANPEAVGAYQRRDGDVLSRAGAPYLPTPTPSLEGSGVRYLIVTTEEFAGEFQRLADHRTAMGLPARVVTREWIEANHRQGVDFQATMRTFLQDAYAKWGVEFLLIGGDVQVIPTRLIRSTFYPYAGHTDVPTDLYFAGLDGNWAADGDGWLGEPYVNVADPGDDADFAADIDVARAPVRSVAAAQNFVNKILAYELAGPAADYANRILFAAEVLFPDPWHEGDPITLDGAQYAEAIIENVIEPCTDMEPLRMYETGATFPYDAPLTRAALVDSLNTGHYGQVNQFGHGHFFNMSVGDANFTVSDASGLTNGPNYFMIFALNCASGAFDVSCLLEAFVENPGGGSIMSIGAAREAFPSNTFGYQLRFYDVVGCDARPRAVAAFNAAKLAYIGNTLRNTVDRWTQLNAVVIGDPATSLWMDQPRVPDLTAPGALTVGEQQVTVQVSHGGSPAAGADVCIVKGDETYDWAVTDGAGNAYLTVIPATGGEAVLTVSGANLAITSTTIPVTGSATYLTVTDVVVDDAVANGNGLPEAGETMQLHVTFEDVGGAGATGLAATLTSTDGELVILDGTTTMADAPPGGTTTTTAPFVVRILASARDGQLVSLRVAATGNGGQEWVSEVNLVVLAPGPSLDRLVIDDATYGNGNGTPEAGERLVIRPYIKNFGSGRLDQTLVQLVDAQPGVTVHAGFGVFGPIGFLAESSYNSGELSITVADVAVANACRLSFSDNYGRTMNQYVEFNPPAAPPEPTADATVAPDAIALRWDPVVGGRILGYNVYRAGSAEGVFERANVDLLRGIAYYEDRGLDQLTSYWYKVTAVDTFLCEGDFSPVVWQGTMPPELENFPLPFTLQTSGASAVGDIDGDGDLEIVLASDEVYAWNHDGSELVDGDNNSQTTGPITGVSGQFEPAGVVLADLDGEPGLEIIASERANARQIHVYRWDGTMLPGWPRTLQTSYNWATPSVGDVDGDGDDEVVVNDTAGRTFVWHHDGTELRDGDNNPATDGVFAVRNEGWAYCSPALFDLDGDGAKDIILGTRYFGTGNSLLAYRYDGTQVAGFPFPTPGTGGIQCSPALADLDRDGDHEIIFFTVNRELYVLHHDGTPYQGFPISFASNFDDSAGPSPGVGNFDGDADYEIVWPVNGGFERMDLVLVDTGIGDGTAGDIMTGWPVQLPCNSEGSPVVGDINGDGVADIIQPVGNSDTETPDLLFALNADGTSVSGFPIRLDGHCRATPVICDVDRDGDVEVVYGSWDRLLHVWDMPFTYNPGLMPWPTFQGNAQRTGVAIQASVTPVADDQVPQAFTVMPPHPNPFNPVTRIRLYVVPGADTGLEVSVFDLRGRRVRQLHSGPATPGWVDLTWDGRDDGGRRQASGVYFVKARQDGEARTFKMTLVK